MSEIEKELVALEKSPLYRYRVKNNYQVVIGEGDLNSKIVFIGEASGKKEAETGKPFCGASGKVLDELLTHIGLARESVYITNIIKDRPPENRDPRPEEIELYTPFLLRQIEIIQPKVIATLGRYAMDFIMRQYGLEFEILPISQAHGKKFISKTKWGDLYIIPLYHPAVAVYNRNKLDELKKDFKILKKVII
ncbi:uracil-DNA glycosylase [Candidatus Campbellbacteria bacterium CG22_combo_CG10-13_8_21_14_all_36_13]|uniref:Type-4 uracil-DNA glycosylase n=1 Tax=Candidatus Campbellbacteria bacterium CG22_combo_CG10-13_8_21_14_all_36_13 TaxID=1974529 RepID=A0A2H0DYL8_9BACT|nr:MAG: uracil-DNA glycosylase [Candidatus Campbellbacteria bacterium CG22_combo_CG10-13_8_21_14_all_36_13]